MELKRTKIVATLGPASSSVEVIKEMYDNGLNVCRLNFSHGDHSVHEENIKRVQQVNNEINSNIAILADLQGPKLRVGVMENEGCEIKNGDIITFTNKECVGTAKKVFMTYQNFAKDVKPGELILIDDGKLAVKVDSSNGVDEVIAVIGKNAILELMKAVDEHIPQPDRPKDKPFLMPVEDVFSISGRGTVVTGRVEQGVIKTGEEIEIVGIKDTKKSVCTGVEMFRKLLDSGEAGDNIGALLRGVERTDVERGQVLAKPGSVTPHTKFEAQAYVLKKEEGGRHTPFFTKYRPQFYFRTTDVTGEVELPSGTEMVMPGDDAKFTVKLITPIAMSEKLNFAIREGGRTVGAGVVTKILE